MTRQEINEQSRLNWLRNPELYRQYARNYYQRNAQRLNAQSRAFYAANYRRIEMRARMGREIERAKGLYPDGFLLILIADAEAWRACPRAQECGAESFKPRPHEFVIAELMPDPDGYGWKVLPWPVIDQAHRQWLKSVQRKERLAQRAAMLAAGEPASVIDKKGRQ